MAFTSTLLEAKIGLQVGLSVTNPATGQIIETVKDYTREETRDAVKAAQEALGPWKALTGKERAGILRKWFDLIIAHTEELAQLITAECGKPLAEARGEVAYGASFVEWFAEEAKRIYGDIIPTHAAGKRILVLKQPIGVVAAITPWNFPVAMITRKVAPALAAGCTALIKPAEATPLSALALETLAVEAGIPAAAFKVITTNDPAGIGKVLTTHPAVRKISFTGSTPVGKLLMAQAAGTVKKVSLELGGNAPFIVFDDADVDAAVAGAMVSKYRNAGQTCVCANRFYVQDGVYEEFVEKFTSAVKALNVGNGAEDNIQVGPLINDAATAKVSKLVDDAMTKGAQATVGGGIHALGGNYFEPTVLSGVTPDMDLCHTEIFGPVAPVVKFSREAEVIALANDTPYGLAAYFYARDIGRVWRVSEALEYGIVGINEGIISTEVAPFGGIKESGMGREGSKYGVDDFVEIKYCLVGGVDQ
jgi:succinate-semialdehyde dehydrogenase/glutarate-semialdehyde dehydrogenase